MRILFVCYANSCRSQIAEAYARYRAPEGVEVASAGLMAAGIHPAAREVMAAWGMSLAGQSSKSLQSLPDERFDVIVSLSERAREPCDRMARGARREHWPILDPVSVVASDPQRLELFARTRDDIAAHVDALLAELVDESLLAPRPAPGAPG